ncbi:MAG: hypothetical protein R2837_04950 [Aliarcobacter sp.]
MLAAVDGSAPWFKNQSRYDEIQLKNIEELAGITLTEDEKN